MFKKKYIFLLSFFLILLTSYFSISHFIGKYKFINLPISLEHKYLIKKYVFPFKFISVQQQKISKYETSVAEKNQLISTFINFALNQEQKFKESLEDIKTQRISDISLSKDLILRKYKLVDGFYAGIYNEYPGSGYIEFHSGKLLVLSARGVLGFSDMDNDKELTFKQIKNNINEFIGLKQFLKVVDNKNNHVDGKEYSLRDITIIKNKIYISFNEEITTDCWNTSIISGEMNYEEIKFRKLFSLKECVHSSDNIDGEFLASQSGGRIVEFDDNHILFSVGEYRLRFLAQEMNSVNGKIIKINTTDSNYEILSMGHRNPQGLYFNKENNYILMTEHGPWGGDEVNLIDLEKFNKNEIPNYGWPIVSAGKHYGMNITKHDNLKYEKYPLYKSHSKHGFIEPLKSFVPAIGIAEIVKIDKNKYVVSSMRDRSLYFFELKNQKEIINLTRVEVFERVRDLKFKNNNLYLFLEDTPSIGVIEINSLK